MTVGKLLLDDVPEHLLYAVLHAEGVLVHEAVEHAVDKRLRVEVV